jgi:hypothetical protein
MPRPTLKPSQLPQVQRVEAHSWREGWWSGICVGIAIGAGLAVILVKA